MPMPGGDDVDWDFSFVGPRHGDKGSPGDEPTDAAAEMDWDFSFVDGERRSTPSRPRTASPAADEDIDWDFSFVGDPVESPRSGAAPRPDEAVPAWDFSFVDGVVDPPAAQDATPAAHLVTDAVEVVVAETSAEAEADVEAEEQPDPAPAVAAPAADDRGGEIPVVQDVDATEELERPERIDALEVEAPAEPADPTEELESYITDSTPYRGEERHDPVKVLTICTHNRTRSVMMMALLQAGFDRAVGEGRVMVRSLGFGPEGEPAIKDAVDEMEDRGLDVSDHRSLQVTTPRVEPADLILTAERDHVIKIADASPDAFRRTFTLPEFCRLIAHDPVPGSRTLREWLHSMSSARTPASYLTEDVPEVDDPTGSPKRQFALATATIESMCDTVVDLLDVCVGRPGWRDPA